MCMVRKYNQIIAHCQTSNRMEFTKETKGKHNMIWKISDKDIKGTAMI